MLKGILKICGEFFCKTAETFFTKSLNHVLQKYRQVVCKNTEKCFVKILRSVFYKNVKKLLQNCLGEFHALTQMNKFFVKIQELGLFPVTSWPSFFGRPKHNERISKGKSFPMQVFNTYKNIKKVMHYTRVMTYGYEEIE